MALPAGRIPISVAHLDIEIVVEVLIGTMPCPQCGARARRSIR